MRRNLELGGNVDGTVRTLRNGGGTEIKGRCKKGGKRVVMKIVKGNYEAEAGQQNLDSAEVH